MDIQGKLNDLFLLQFFSASRYIALLYDMRGNPVWAARREFHKFKDVILELMSAPASRFFHLPVPENLDASIKSYVHGHPESAMFLKTLDEIPHKVSFSLGDFSTPIFNSKNLFASKNIAPHFMTDLPHCLLRLLRITESHFLGVITFPDQINELAASLRGSSMALVADRNDRLIAYNIPLREGLSLKDPKALLNMPLEDIVRFSRPYDQAPKPVMGGAFSPETEWTAGGKNPPFALAPESPGSLKITPQGALFENTHPESYGYLFLKNTLDVRLNEFRLRVDFEAEDSAMANIIFSGTQYKPGRFPDDFGYMLINVSQGRYEFKKGGAKVRNFALPGGLSGRAHRVEIEKIGNWYGICVDNKRIGTWFDTRPLHGESDNLIYVFLMPNQKLLIKNIELQSRPVRQPDSGNADEALTALFPDHLPGRVFSVHIDQYAVHGENFTAFEFDDITALERNISSLRSERNKLAALLGQENEFVGRSIPITNIHQDLRRIAASTLSVLIEGETGTGKEVLARAIHGYSPRADGPFVKIDCAAIPRELLESELFGHERGAFTGASSAHAGKFEQAMGGTVFLDEISNIPVATQAKLLNVLQDLRVQRLGSQKPLTLDVRIVAATNRPLSALIKEKLFREDLYYRINQFRFALPPLRERGEDIPLLAVHFIKLANQTYKKKVKGLTTEAARLLMGHAWPGNVRELRNVIFRAVVFCDGDEIRPADISIEAGEAAVAGPARRGGKTSVISRERLEAVLDDVEGNIARASRKLGISRVSLYALLKRHGLKAGDFKISKS